MALLNISPVLRLSFIMALITINLLIVADMFGFMPDQSEIALKERKITIQTLLWEIKTGQNIQDKTQLNDVLESIIIEHENISAMEVIHNNESLIIGNETALSEASSQTTELALTTNNTDDITLKIHWLTNSSVTGDSIFNNPFLRLLLFIGSLGFLIYLLLLRRTLKHLDPTTIMPERVRTMMDSLTESMVLLGDDGTIVMANISFCDLVNLPIKKIPGMTLEQFDWKFKGNNLKKGEAPWEDVLQDGITRSGQQILLKTSQKQTFHFFVNAAPIMDDNKQVRGAMVTFDDQTELVATNNELHNALKMMEEQQQEIRRQNEELTVMATRDSLTGCLNRRVFFEIFEKEFSAASKHTTKLACIMCDIDLFKSVNDNYGHGKGDDILRAASSILQKSVRDNDYVCRMGGEEFCILVTGFDLVEIERMAERIRIAIEKAEKMVIDTNRSVTMSFGVTAMENTPINLNDMMEQADKALYFSKTNGRNRTSCFNKESIAA